MSFNKNLRNLNVINQLEIELLNDMKKEEYENTSLFSSIGNLQTGIINLENNFNSSFGNLNNSINNSFGSLNNFINFSFGSLNTSINTSINTLTNSINTSFGNLTNSINTLDSELFALELTTNQHEIDSNFSFSNLKSNFSTSNLVFSNVEQPLNFNSNGNLNTAVDNLTIQIKNGELALKQTEFVIGDDPMTVRSIGDYINLFGITLEQAAALFGIDQSIISNFSVISLDYNSEHFTESNNKLNLKTSNLNDKEMMFYDSTTGLQSISQNKIDFGTASTTIGNLCISNDLTVKSGLTAPKITASNLYSSFSTINNLKTTEIEADRMNLVSLTLANLTTTNDAINLLHFNSTTASLVRATIGNLENNIFSSTNSSITNLKATNSTLQNLQNTNSTIQNIHNDYITSLGITTASLKTTSDTVFLEYFSNTNSNIINSSISSLHLTNGDFDNITISNLNVSTGNIASLYSSISTIGNLVNSNFIGSSGTIANLNITQNLNVSQNVRIGGIPNVSSFCSIANLYASNITIGSIETINATSANITTVTVGSIEIGSATLLRINASSANLSTATIGTLQISSISVSDTTPNTNSTLVSKGYADSLIKVEAPIKLNSGKIDLDYSLSDFKLTSGKLAFGITYTNIDQRVKKLENTKDNKQGRQAGEAAGKAAGAGVGAAVGGAVAGVAGGLVKAGTSLSAGLVGGIAGGIAGAGAGAITNVLMNKGRNGGQGSGEETVYNSTTGNFETTGNIFLATDDLIMATLEIISNTGGNVYVPIDGNASWLEVSTAANLLVNSLNTVSINNNMLIHDINNSISNSVVDILKLRQGLSNDLTGSRIKIGGGNSHYAGIVGKHIGGGATVLEFQTDDYLGGTQNLQTKMKINNNGNVGINTLNPNYKLDVAGSFKSESVLTTNLTTTNLSVSNINSLPLSSYVNADYLGGTVLEAQNIIVYEDLSTSSINNIPITQYLNPDYSTSFTTSNLSVSTLNVSNTSSISYNQYTGFSGGAILSEGSLGIKGDAIILGELRALNNPVFIANASISNIYTNSMFSNAGITSSTLYLSNNTTVSYISNPGIWIGASLVSKGGIGIEKNLYVLGGITANSQSNILNLSSNNITTSNLNSTFVNVNGPISYVQTTSIFATSGSISGVLNLEGGTVSDSQVDLANRQNTYIRFGQAATGSDWAYLRQTGGDNAMNLSLDLHDDIDDGAFEIRRVISTNTPDTIISLLKIQRNTGNIGIGIDNPTAKLHILDKTALVTNYDYSLIKLVINEPGTTDNVGTNIEFSGHPAFKSTIGGRHVGSGATDLRFKTNGASTGDNPVLRMLINSNGNVGIGTDNPIYKLDVNGSFKSTSVKSTELENENIKGLQLKTTTGNNQHVAIGSSSTTNVFLKWDHATSLGVISTYNASNNIMLMEPGAGNVGIGTQNPSAKLHVNGDIIQRPTFTNITTASSVTYSVGNIVGGFLRQALVAGYTDVIPGYSSFTTFGFTNGDVIKSDILISNQSINITLTNGVFFGTSTTLVGGNNYTLTIRLTPESTLQMWIK